jgi:hypothetical protein
VRASPCSALGERRKMVSRKFEDLWNQTVEIDTFCRRVAELNAYNKPVKLYLGAGHVPRQGFINLDKVSMEPARAFFESNPDDYIIFPFAEQPWPLPDSSIDYIYHEDFFEHIPQKNQILLLAETLRVLKPGAIHRINTPDLTASMKRHSNFAAGFKGVYADEWDRWAHISLITRYSLEEMALMIGYRFVYFTPKSGGTSPHAVADDRPHGDRDQISGNIFADLLK